MHVVSLCQCVDWRYGTAIGCAQTPRCCSQCTVLLASALLHSHGYYYEQIVYSDLFLAKSIRITIGKDCKKCLFGKI